METSPLETIATLSRMCCMGNPSISRMWRPILPRRETFSKQRRRAVVERSRRGGAEGGGQQDTEGDGSEPAQERSDAARREAWEGDGGRKTTSRSAGMMGGRPHRARAIGSLFRQHFDHPYCFLLVMETETRK